MIVSNQQQAVPWVLSWVAYVIFSNPLHTKYEERVVESPTKILAKFLGTMLIESMKFKSSKSNIICKD